MPLPAPLLEPPSPMRTPPPGASGRPGVRGAGAPGEDTGRAVPLAPPPAITIGVPPGPVTVTEHAFAGAATGAGGRAAFAAQHARLARRHLHGRLLAARLQAVRPVGPAQQRSAQRRDAEHPGDEPGCHGAGEPQIAQSQPAIPQHPLPPLNSTLAGRRHGRQTIHHRCDPEI